jgi:hypothetical protein
MGEREASVPSTKPLNPSLHIFLASSTSLSENASRQSSSVTRRNSLRGIGTDSTLNGSLTAFLHWLGGHSIELPSVRGTDPRSRTRARPTDQRLWAGPAPQNTPGSGPRAIRRAPPRAPPANRATHNHRTAGTSDPPPRAGPADCRLNRNRVTSPGGSGGTRTKHFTAQLRKHVSHSGATEFTKCQT